MADNIKKPKLPWKSIVSLSVVLILSIVNMGGMPSTDVRYLDKIEHLLLYMCLTLVLTYDIRKTFHAGDSLQIAFITAAVFSSLFGGLMELLQMVPALQRSAETGDFLANTAGAFLSPLLYPRFEKIVDFLTGEI